MVKNARVLAEKLQEAGCRVVTGGTDNHLVLLDLSSKKLSGAKGERILEEVAISGNKNASKSLDHEHNDSPFVSRSRRPSPFQKVPGDKSALNPSGIRLGTPPLTTRGLKEKDFEKVVEFIVRGETFNLVCTLKSVDMQNPS